MQKIKDRTRKKPVTMKCSACQKRSNDGIILPSKVNHIKAGIVEMRDTHLYICASCQLLLQLNGYLNVEFVVEGEDGEQITRFRRITYYEKDKKGSRALDKIVPAIQSTNGDVLLGDTVKSTVEEMNELVNPEERGKCMKCGNRYDGIIVTYFPDEKMILCNDCIAERDVSK